MSIENILDRIGVDIENSIEEIREKTRAEVAAIAKEYAHRAEKLKSELEGKAHARAKEEERRLIVSEQLELRKTILAKKREILDELYRAAVKRLESISGEEFLELVQELITSNAVSGREEIIISSKQKKLFTPGFMKKLNGSYAGTGSFTVADDQGDFSWGVVLREGKRAVDLSLEVLFEQLKEKIESQIAEVLFSEKQETG